MDLKTERFNWTMALVSVAIFAYAVPALSEEADSKKTTGPVEIEETQPRNEVTVVCYVTLAEIDANSKTPEIVGTITTKEGKTANLRLSNPERMRPRIAKNAGKAIKLIGEFMQNDSVFLAHDIAEKTAEPEAPPAGPPEGF